MKIAGLVAEFNPLTLGHEYIINKIKEDNIDLLVVAMSPNFTMRGEPAIFDKFERTKIALEKGVDIVSEIRTIYAIESASNYAYRAVEILNKLKITDLYFGVESTNIDLFYKLINDLKTDEYKTLFKKYQKDGLSYNSSFKKAIVELNSEYSEIIEYPNNSLAIYYLLAIEKINNKIIPHFIKRVESGYYSKLDDSKLIQSATSIRGLIEKGKNTTYLSYPTKNLNIHVKNDYFDLIKYRILSMSKDELKEIKGISEGLENKIKSIKDFNSYDELKELLISKRNRETKINRILMYILLNIKKSEDSSSKIDYVKILGFNKKGQEYLKVLDDKEIITRIKRGLVSSIYREIDFTKIYSIKDDDGLELNEYSSIIKN